MKKSDLRSLIREMIEEELEEDSDLSAQAKSRGLHHIGWGRYADKSGKIVAKSVDGKLVNVNPKEKDPEIDIPTPEEEPEWKAKNWKQHMNWTVGDDELKYHKKLGFARGARMGSGWETRNRDLPPGDVRYDEDEPTLPYTARNPEGKIAQFSNDTIASAFAAGKSLEGYDFYNDRVNSIEKLKKELKPILDKFKKQGRKAEFKKFVRDLFTAFIGGAVNTAGYVAGVKLSKKAGGSFGGGGGFSGGGSGGRF